MQCVYLLAVVHRPCSDTDTDGGDRPKLWTASLAQACSEINDDSAKDGTLLVLWASIEMKSHNVAKAREILEAAAIRFPLDPKIPQFHGNVEERAKNFHSALQLYEKSLELDPSVESYISLARLITNHRAELSGPERDMDEEVSFFDVPRPTTGTENAIGVTFY